MPNLCLTVYFTIEMQLNIFLKIFLVPYAFIGFNLRVGKFNVSAFNMNIFASMVHQAQVNEQRKRISRLQLVQAHIPDHESWTTVIKNHLNVKDIWSGHGV